MEETMKEIAIIRVRTAHDLEWDLPPGVGAALDLAGGRGLPGRIRRTRGQAFMPQLTLPYLAALAEAHDRAAGTRHRYTLVDAREEDVPAGGMDMAWLTAVTTNAPATYRVSDRLRARGIPTVLGGIHPSTLPDEAAVHATSVAIGEGEDIVGAILADFDAGRFLKTRYEGTRRQDLGGLPVPRWTSALSPDLCPWIVPVQTSRGCRNACAFCSTTRFQGAARRHRPVAEVADEIRSLQDAGVLTSEKTVFFTDNNIVSDTDHRHGVRDTRHARALFEALLPLGITWVGQGEVSVAEDPELVDLMSRSGCHMLLTGFESVRQDGLDGLGKTANRVAAYEPAIEMLHRHGVALIGCFILGLNGEGPGIIEDTRRFIDRHIDVPQVSVLTPFPGTPLHRRMKAEGRLLHEDWSLYDIAHVVFRPQDMAAEDLDQGYRRLTRDLFSHRAILRRALRYATTSTVNGMPAFGFAGRLSSILAPNLVYRRLARLGSGMPSARPVAPRVDSAGARPRAPGLAATGPLAAAGPRTGACPAESAA
jgi:radical SAM superfamily enzyme YgiQ (UPF0313 family)